MYSRSYFDDRDNGASPGMHRSMPGTHNPTTRPHNHHHQHPQDDYYEDDSEIYVDSTYHGVPQQQHHHHHHHGGGPPPPPPPPRVSRITNLQPPNHHHQAPPSISTTPRPMTPMYNPSLGNNNGHLHRPHTTTPSEYSSVSKTKNKNKGGVVIETMRTPMNPCCPDSKGVCCVLLLVNLGLILVTLGFSIVLQLFEPPFVWYCGLLFLIVGFIALIVSLLFCMRICRYSRWSNSSNRSNSSIHGGHGGHGGREPSELFWTHHWQKRINLPGTTSRTSHVHDNSDIVFHSDNRRGMSSSS